MGRIVYAALLASVWAWGGFFNSTQPDSDAEALENKRLCEIFTHKAEEYQKHMRDDVLARTTLASYKHRAEMFCGRVPKDKNATSEAH